MLQKHVVQFGDGDRHQLRSLLRKCRVSARCLTRARILLSGDEEIAELEKA
jgi:hypothetical protein